MKILFVTHYAESYGANLSMLSLIEGLKQHGVDSVVLLPAIGEFTNRLEDRNVPYTVQKFYPWFQYRWKSKNVVYKLARDIEHRVLGAFRLVKNYGALVSLKKRMETSAFDCIYSNTSISPFGSLLAQNLNIPHIWHLRETAISHLNLHPDVGMQLVRKFISKSRVIITISKTVANEFYKDELPEKALTIYNGLFWKKELRKQSLPDNEQFTIAIVGLLHKNKGQAQAIRVLHLLVKAGIEAKLLVAGTGDIDSLQTLVDELKLRHNVKFLGYVNDPFSVYKRADIVLMCSTNEGLGRVTLEAMAACRPVVGKASGGTVEIITDEHNGLLYDGTDEDLVSCILKLYDNSKLVTKIVDNGFSYVRSNFTIEEYTNKIHRLLLVACKNM